MCAIAKIAVAAGLLRAILATTALGAGAPERVDVRVGLVAPGDFEAEFSRWRTVFSELSENHQPPLSFRVAVGTYGDVAHWMERELIDVAILTPGVFAEGCQGHGGADPSSPFRYVATVGLPPAASKWSLPDRRRPGYHYRYRSVCVVSAGSALKTLDDLRRAAQRGRVRFVFVHPLSVSGRIAPEFALRGLGIQPAREKVDFTNSHTGSMRLVARADEQRVGFVWDDALRAAPELAGSVRRLEFPELESLDIPADVVVAREGFKHFNSLAALLTGHLDPSGTHDFAAIEDCAEQYGVVRRWSRALGLSALSGEAQSVTLDEIGQILLHSAHSQPEPPRLALVLSGGGAKCSYQVGAVAALEEELAELRRQDPESQLDIALVVGTSGGAINAVPIAMGVTSTEAGRADFRDVWQGLDQRELVRPAGIVRANLGLWFALVQAGCVLWLVRRCVSRPQRRGWVASGAFVALAIVEACAGYFPGPPWKWLGENHLWHHAWLWCTFGIRPSAWCLLGLGLAGLLFQAILARRGRFLEVPTRLLVWGLTVCLLGLPIAQLVTVFFFQETLSGGEGMERVLAEQLPLLLDRHLRRRGEPGLVLDDASNRARRLEAVSRQLIQGRRLKRDLVVTGNCLRQSRELLPSDVYFYAAADPGSRPPAFGARGIPLGERPSILLDVVLGSGTIFPVFPPRTLRDFPEPGEHVELIDGGFAHNSPIEAAVLWGATHVVLIEATPAKRRLSRNFAGNAAAAFTHLHKQTQLVDVRSKRQVMVFTLTPEPPHVCVLDFADNLITDSIARGYHDARGQTPSSDAATACLPRFRKELGEPVFTGVPIARSEP